MSGLKTFAEVWAEVDLEARTAADVAIESAIDALAIADGPVEAVTLTVRLRLSRAEDGKVDVRPTVASATKRAPIPAATWYVSPRGELVAEDPRQPRLPGVR